MIVVSYFQINIKAQSMHWEQQYPDDDRPIPQEFREDREEQPEYLRVTPAVPEAPRHTLETHLSRPNTTVQSYVDSPSFYTTGLPHDVFTRYHQALQFERPLAVSIDTCQRDNHNQIISWSVDMTRCTPLLIGRNQAHVHISLTWSADDANWVCTGIGPSRPRAPEPRMPSRRP